MNKTLSVFTDIILTHSEIHTKVTLNLDVQLEWTQFSQYNLVYFAVMVTEIRQINNSWAKLPQLCESPSLSHTNTHESPITLPLSFSIYLSLYTLDLCPSLQFRVNWNPLSAVQPHSFTRLPNPPLIKLWFLHIWTKITSQTPYRNDPKNICSNAAFCSIQSDSPYYGLHFFFQDSFISFLNAFTSKLFLLNNDLLSISSLLKQEWIFPI